MKRLRHALAALFGMAGILIAIGGCKNSTEPDRPEFDPPTTVARVTDAEFAALSARVAALEAAVDLNDSPDAIFFRVHGEEVAQMHNSNNVRGMYVPGRLQVDGLGNAFALTVGGDAQFAGGNIFKPATLNAKNQTTLTLYYAIYNPFNGTYSTTPRNIYVGGANSGGTGWRTLLVEN